MALDSKQRKLLHQKGQKPITGKGKPNKADGKDGDVAYKDIQGEGTVHFIKARGDWKPLSSSGSMPTSRSIIGGTSRRGGSGVSSHDGLTGLGDDDHLQYILADGTRALTADWNVGAFDITAVDLNATGDLDVDGTVQIDGTVTVGVDDTGYDVKFFGATSSAYLLWDESADELIIAGGAAISIDTTTDASSTTTGSFHTDGGVGIAKKLYVGTDLDVDGISNLDNVDIDGTSQIDGTVTVGIDDTGYDVKFFGATASKFFLWDESADTLVINDKISFVSQGSGESISGDGTDVIIDAGTAINLVANSVDIGKNAESDVIMTFLGASNNGVYRWMEDEDYFKFSDDLLIEGNEKLYLNSTSAWLYSESGGYVGAYPSLHVGPTGTSPYVTNYAINIEPQTSGRHLTSGEADYQENYSWLSLYLLQSDTTTFDNSFGVWV